jgi:hypothetical protein
LWASSKLHGLPAEADKQAIVDELWRKQEADGGWSIQSAGQRKKREAEAVGTGSNSYISALAAFTTQQAVVQPSQAGCRRRWLD